MLKHVILTLVIAAVVVIAGALLVIDAGWYDVSVSNRDTGLRGWVLSTTMDNSVEHHAKGLTPPALDDTARIKEGFEHYSRMCAGCHGAPGRDNAGARERFNPAPPPLVYAAKDWTAPQLFWIIKHGVKMSAMPAFGTTHDDDHIWDIVAFLQVMPSMKASEYQRMWQASRAEPHHDDD